MLLDSSEEVVLHLEAVTLELGVLDLELAHKLLVLFHLVQLNKCENGWSAATGEGPHP